MMLDRYTPTALLFVTICAVACAIVTVVLQVMPQFGIRFFPGLWMTTAALIPLFIARPMATHLFRRVPRQLRFQETLVFAALVLAPIAVIGLVTEAAIITGFLAQNVPVPFSEVLFAPLENRYAIEVIFGFRFFTSIMLAAALSCLIYIPGQMARKTLMARAAPDAD